MATNAARATLATWRLRIAADPAGATVPAVAVLASEAAALDAPKLRTVINATGVIVHTNLGRAPLAASAAEAARRLSSGYANLELDLEHGDRGSRQSALSPLLRELTGAEDAIAVGNCAAALLLVLAALAHGREVIVSRGQLVEIGDGFRIPDILTQSGGRLVEVGTTNRTSEADYEQAINENTAMILRVHPSNYRVVGFTAEVSIDRLATIAGRHDVPLVDDIGSGLLRPDPLLPGEPAARTSISAGAGLVSFSGDKLLGGPQAGIIVGRADLVDRVRRHPLARALRIGKLATAALEETLRLHRDPDHARRHVPVMRRLHEPVASVEARAATIAAALGAEVVPSEARVGGGASPATPIPSAACSLADAKGLLARRIRVGEIAVLGRSEDGCLLLDARTIAEADVPRVIAAVRAALS